jgi:hypothetical protein
MNPVYADDIGKTPKKANGELALCRQLIAGNPVQFRARRLTPPFPLS